MTNDMSETVWSYDWDACNTVPGADPSVDNTGGAVTGGIQLPQGEWMVSLRFNLSLDYDPSATKVGGGATGQINNPSGMP